MASEFQGCHEGIASERALESGWESWISLVEEVKLQNYLSRNVFRAFTFGAEIGDSLVEAGLAECRQRLALVLFFSSAFEQLTLAF